MQDVLGRLALKAAKNVLDRSIDRNGGVLRYNQAGLFLGMLKPRPPRRVVLARNDGHAVAGRFDRRELVGPVSVLPKDPSAHDGLRPQKFRQRRIEGRIENGELPGDIGLARKDEHGRPTWPRAHAQGLGRFGNPGRHLAQGIPNDLRYLLRNYFSPSPQEVRHIALALVPENTLDQRHHEPFGRGPDIRRHRLCGKLLRTEPWRSDRPSEALGLEMGRRDRDRQVRRILGRRDAHVVAAGTRLTARRKAFAAGEHPYRPRSGPDDLPKDAERGEDRTRIVGFVARCCQLDRRPGIRIIHRHAQRDARAFIGALPERVHEELNDPVVRPGARRWACQLVSGDARRRLWGDADGQVKLLVCNDDRWRVEERIEGARWIRDEFDDVHQICRRWLPWRGRWRWWQSY